MIPTPQEIKSARLAARLTQTQAAELIGHSLRSWQNWERPIGNKEHRTMNAALWELWRIKLVQRGGS